MNPKESILRWAALKAAHFFAKHPVFLIIVLILYLLSPFDLVPEALVGPLGFLDDLLIILLPVFLREYARRVRPTDIHDTTAR